MGEMLLNGRLYGANGVMELTQAQYDALPQSKLTDGVLYCIKDTGYVEGEQFAPVIYSLEEREIGTWLDGKPMYKKTVRLNALPSTTYSPQSIAHNIANIDTVCDYNVIIHWTNGHTAKQTRLGIYSNSSLVENFNNSIEIEVNKTSFVIMVGTDRSSNSADITVYYTKTTDVAGSGTFGIDGARMVHYSNDEHIIGTWTDGKTLYEKTVHINAMPSTTFTEVQYPHNISNIDTICDCTGVARWSDGGIAPLGTRIYVAGSSASSSQYMPKSGAWQFQVNKTAVLIAVTSDRSTLNADVTIRYTKTT